MREEVLVEQVAMPSTTLNTILTILIINLIITNIFMTLMMIVRRNLLNGENPIACGHAFNDPASRRQAHLIIMWQSLLVETIGGNHYWLI